MTRLDWDRARRRPSTSDHIRSVRGISNGQARDLARLQRAAGLPYTGAGMSAIAAAALIRKLEAGTSNPPTPAVDADVRIS